MHLTAEADFLSGTKSSALVSCEIPADLETPLSAYWKLSKGESQSFLLESVVGGESLARYSILGARPKSVIRGKGDPRPKIRKALQHRSMSRLDSLPKFTGGLVGCLSFDCAGHFEVLPRTAERDLDLDDFALMETDGVVVFDHARNVMHLCCSSERSPEGYQAAANEVRRISELLQSDLPAIPECPQIDSDIWSNMEPEEYIDSVRKAINYISAGDCIQVVLSQRFCTEAPCHPISYYRTLRSLNPSPYMFLVRFGDFDVVGASPEILVGLENRKARLRPIAGTRPRGHAPETDVAFEKELLADDKERAEHVMLVDLGRNDLGRVCEVGSVQVEELMTVERYSHVMHIVSNVSGELKPELDAMDLLAACFPAGTVSGAPKIRAMEIIDELEPCQRGTYAGAVGYFGDDGNMDLCIAIRTILLKDSMAYVQAGAGIVYDSVPESEYLETCNKAAACLSAIAKAHGAEPSR